MNKLLLILSFLFLQFASFAQSVDIQPIIEPEFFAADEEITITYNVTGTSLASLNDVYMWMWLPNVK